MIKERYFNIALPDAEVEIIDSEDDAFVGWEEVKCNNWSVASFLVPVGGDGVVLASGFVG